MPAFQSTHAHWDENPWPVTIFTVAVSDITPAKLVDFIVTAISTAADKAILTSKSGRPESQPVLDETLALIKEKRRLRRQYSQAHDPLVKTRINQLQKEIKDNLRI